MIRTETAKVYRAERAGRRYLSLAAAVNAEARAIIKAKYSTERQYIGDSGYCEDPGFHWSSMPNAEKMHRRLALKVRAAFTKEPTP